MIRLYNHFLFAYNIYYNKYYDITMLYIFYSIM